MPPIRVVSRMAAPDPLREYRRIQLRYDLETRRVLERTARSIRARIRTITGTGIGAEVRRSQLTLVLNQINRILSVGWDDVAGVVQAGRRNATEKAAEIAVDTLAGVARTALGDDGAEQLIAGLKLTALSGIANDMARVPRELSLAVYRNRRLTVEQVNRLIREGLSSGLSARELARDVYEHVSPTTPGGASYAAMRLARTEINNAFHERQKQGAERVGVSAAKWNLSGSHKVPDECNLYATQDLHGLGAGMYPAGTIPDKPHPQCLCYLTYETMGPKQFQQALAAGRFDEELDRRTKANLARLGVVPNKPLTKPVPESSKADTPARWKEQSRTDYRKQREEQLFKQIQWNNRKAPQGDDYDRDTAKFLAEKETPEGAQIWSLGAEGKYHVVSLKGKTPDEVIADAQTVISGLSKTNPLPKGVQVVFHSEKSHVGSAVTTDAGEVIRLYEALDKPGILEDWAAAYFMQRADVETRARYTCSHEYGHALMFQKDHGPKALELYGRYKNDLSGYAQEDYKEAYAEAFAQWTLTEGTSDNKAVRAYAKEFGWHPSEATTKKVKTPARLEEQDGTSF